MKSRRELRLDPNNLDPYMEWRRRDSISRFVGKAGLKGIINIDAYEYCAECYEPLLFVETVDSRITEPKSWTATRKLAARVGVPAVLVTYVVAADPNPKCPHGTLDLFEIQYETTDGTTGVVTPHRWAKKLKQVHDRHHC